MGETPVLERLPEPKRTKWAVVVTFMKGGKYPGKPIAVIVETDAYWTAAARGIEKAKKHLPPRTRVDEFSVRIRRIKDGS